MNIIKDASMEAATPSSTKVQITFRAAFGIPERTETRVFDCSPQRFRSAWSRWTSGGELIQNAFSFLDAEDREWLMNGNLLDVLDEEQP